jgi:hypothetical protein
LDALVLLFLCVTADFRLPKALPNREEGEPDRIFGRSQGVWTEGEFRLGQQAAASARTDASAVAGLARFFPEAAPVRIPVQIGRCDAGAGSAPGNFTESTVIEFGTPREVLFACNTPLEFADILRLRNSDGSLDVEVSVVAVQYHPGKIVVAARFQGEVPNWIVKP